MSSTNHVTVSRGMPGERMKRCIRLKARVWLKKQKKKRWKALCIPHCGNNRALCTLLSTCFPFMIGVSAKCMQSRDEESAVEVDCQPLFTLGQHQLWISATFTSSIPPCVTLPALLTLPGQEIVQRRTGQRCPPSPPLVTRIEPARV